ncbi:hypothetical protein [Thermus sp.]|uniref:hypothetical protein n=1 Tax=Thermus sp. TaxID=275 RepID=UPI002635CA76|nr:hypothetical protein [Thermus sp.]MCX7851002.1 hypothetical protein [Thermus sp.]
MAVLAAMGALVAVRAHTARARMARARATLTKLGVYAPEDYLTTKEMDVLGKILTRGVIWKNSRGELMFSPWESDDVMPVTLGGGRVIINVGTITLAERAKGVDLAG